MFFKTLIFLSLIKAIFGRQTLCSHEVALKLAKRSVYDFSIEILERVRIAANGHFVFTPLPTWLQLMNLMEGARGETRAELQKITGHHKHKCFRRKLRESINGLIHEEQDHFKINSLIVIDRLMNVKGSFKAEVKKSQFLDVLLLDFQQPEASAAFVNKLIADKTEGLIDKITTPEEFQLTYLQMFDVAYYKSFWLVPFNTENTKKEVFYSDDGYPIGYVENMSQIGVFNFTSILKFNLDVLELPCDDKNQISMLVFLNKEKGKADQIFLHLNNTRLASIFNKFSKEGPKTLEVILPRFEINTEIDNLPELVYDMGVKSLFYLDKANLKGISDFKLIASTMVQKAKIKVTEGGLEASSVSEYLVNRDGVTQFKANRPFSYIIVDKNAHFILFAGMYSLPDFMP